MTRDPDQMKRIALMALQADPSAPAATLEKILRYAFDQLCWVGTGPQLLALLDSLNAKLEPS